MAHLHMIQSGVQHPIGATAISGSATVVSFFATTLPVVQWIAALVAVIVGLIAIAGVIKKKWFS
jgi:hypothetical protein